MPVVTVVTQSRTRFKEVSPHPLAKLITAILEVRDQKPIGHTLLIGVAGSVGVGKTTFASSLAQQLGAQTISTDGFLLPNRELEARGLIDRKGFPESYDHEAIRGFISALRNSQWPVTVPMYSHELFDVVAGLGLEQSTVVIAEGINALQRPLQESLDVAIYLHTDEQIVEQWFVERMLRFIVDAETKPGGFYDRFVAWDVGRRTDFARHVWHTINLPNLRDHIAPTVAKADWIVEFDAEHQVRQIRRSN
jgi:type I pantothenate kinase